jgi:hypothetical protein
LQKDTINTYMENIVMCTVEEYVEASQPAIVVSESKPKSQKSITLHGMKDAHTKARIGAEVLGFMNDTGSIKVWETTSDTYTMITNKGRYELKKHESANRYQGTCNGVKVHFCPKKIKATLIYWA